MLQTPIVSLPLL